LRLGDSVFDSREISEKLFRQLLQTIQGLLSKVHKYKESLLLSLVSEVTEKPIEDFTLVLIYGPPKKYKIGA
jgi:hypothetical protein